jgi:hypothetical protein
MEFDLRTPGRNIKLRTSGLGALWGICEPKRSEIIEGASRFVPSPNIIKGGCQMNEDEIRRTWYIPDSIRMVSGANLYCVTNYPKCDLSWFPSHLLGDCWNSFFR